MKLFSAMNLARKTSVFILAFWLAGAGCLLGCEGVANAAPAGHHDWSTSSDKPSTLVVEGDACASTENHSCCKKKSRASKQQAAPRAQLHKRHHDPASSKLNESSTSGMKACPFAVARALSVAKVRDGDGGGAATPVAHSLPARTVAEQSRALSAVSPLPNRGHTYLRCCSFLI